jgi:ferredoxin
MTHVVTARCLDCRYTDCCTVCPVEAFRRLDDPAMLVIDPGVCIDCMLCVPACPVHAIYADNELPGHYAEWKELNEQLSPHGTTTKVKEDPLPGAPDLPAVHAREKTAGWPSVEPANAPG